MHQIATIFDPKDICVNRKEASIMSVIAKTNKNKLIPHRTRISAENVVDKMNYYLFKIIKIRVLIG
jgi:hypothetical protein